MRERALLLLEVRVEPEQRQEVVPPGEARRATLKDQNVNKTWENIIEKGLKQS